jgi:hypothetical protein
MAKADDLKAAVVEAERFIEKANTALTWLGNQSSSYYGTSKDVAAAKRASMDLTRTLVKVRH